MSHISFLGLTLGLYCSFHGGILHLMLTTFFWREGEARRKAKLTLEIQAYKNERVENLDKPSL